MEVLGPDFRFPPHDVLADAQSIVVVPQVASWRTAERGMDVYHVVDGRIADIGSRSGASPADAQLLATVGQEAGRSIVLRLESSTNDSSWKKLCAAVREQSRSPWIARESYRRRHSAGGCRDHHDSGGVCICTHPTR